LFNSPSYGVHTYNKVPLLEAGKQASPFMRPQQIARGQDFEGAVRAADKYASEVFDRSSILKMAPWRNKPASQKQLEYLRKFQKKNGERLELDELTIGQAGDWITKIIHGAKGRLSNLQTRKNKVQKELSAEKQLQRLKRREQVQVGPLGSTGDSLPAVEADSTPASASKPSKTFAEYFKERQHQHRP
ncbi:hypothetical protein LTS18_012412, partial [Coniosporium uncinatum]